MAFRTHEPTPEMLASLDWLITKSKKAEYFIILYTGTIDAKLICEVGVAVLHDKPLAVIALEGATVPHSMELHAAMIERATSKEELSLAVKRIVEAMDREVQARHAER